MVTISQTLKNCIFLSVNPFFHTFGGLEIGPFCAARAHGCKGVQSAFINENNFFLKNFRIGSKLSRDGFVAS